MGISIIRAVVDDFDLRKSDGGGTVLVLTKRCDLSERPVDRGPSPPLGFDRAASPGRTPSPGLVSRGPSARQTRAAGGPHARCPAPAHGGQGGVRRTPRRSVVDSARMRQPGCGLSIPPPPRTRQPQPSSRLGTSRSLRTGRPLARRSSARRLRRTRDRSSQRLPGGSAPWARTRRDALGRRDRRRARLRGRRRRPHRARRGRGGQVRRQSRRTAGAVRRRLREHDRLRLRPRRGCAVLGHRRGGADGGGDGYPASRPRGRLLSLRVAVRGRTRRRRAAHPRYRRPAAGRAARGDDLRGRPRRGRRRLGPLWR